MKPTNEIGPERKSRDDDANLYMEPMNYVLAVFLISIYLSSGVQFTIPSWPNTRSNYIDSYR
jgi:hypothetical protein